MAWIAIILRGKVKRVLQQSSKIGLHTIVLQQPPKYYLEHNALHVTDNMVRRLGIQKYQSAIDMF